MKTTVKKWFRDKNYGFLHNGTGRDVKVNQSDLLNCKYLKVGATVEFECHIDNKGLIARKVKLCRQANQNQDHRGDTKPFRFGVMT